MLIASGANLRNLNLRVAAATAIVVSPLLVVVAWAATAHFGHQSNDGYNGTNYGWHDPSTLSGDQYLWSRHKVNLPTWTDASGWVKPEPANCRWSTFAWDDAKYYGQITNADPPRWEVWMKTAQTVKVYASGTHFDVFQSRPGTYWTSEVKHLGYGMANGEVMVYDGAHFKVKDGLSYLFEVRWEAVSATQQIPYAYVQADETSNPLSNIQVDADGNVVFAELTQDFDTADLLVELKAKSYELNLTNKTFTNGYGISWYQEVWLEVNREGNWAGLFEGTATAYNDGTSPPTVLQGSPFPFN